MIRKYGFERFNAINVINLGRGTVWCVYHFLSPVSASSWQAEGKPPEVSLVRAVIAEI